MFCPKCGTNNADGAAFCVSCGAPLQQAPQGQPQQPQQNGYNYQQPQQNGYGWQQPAAPQPPKKNKKTMAIVISIAAVLVVAAIVVVLVLTLGGKDSGKTGGKDDEELEEVTYEGSTDELHEEPKLEKVFFSYIDAFTHMDYEKLMKVIPPAVRKYFSDDYKETFDMLKDEFEEEHVKFKDLQVEKVQFNDDKDEYRDLEEELEEAGGESVHVTNFCVIEFSGTLKSDHEEESDTGRATFAEIDGDWYFIE